MLYKFFRQSPREIKKFQAEGLEGSYKVPIFNSISLSSERKN